jgi:hypothetical protein
MQKVVGSSPIIRSSKPAGNGGFFFTRGRSAGGEPGETKPLEEGVGNEGSHVFAGVVFVR